MRLQPLLGELALVERRPRDPAALHQLLVAFGVVLRANKLLQQVLDGLGVDPERPILEVHFVRLKAQDRVQHDARRQVIVVGQFLRRHPGATGRDLQRQLVVGLRPRTSTVTSIAAVAVTSGRRYDHLRRR